MGEFENISVKRLLEVFLANVRFIVAVTLLFAIGSFVYSETMVIPMYSASVKLYINNVESGLKLENKMLGSDITASQMLVPTCVEIVKSDRMLNKVAESDDYGYTAAYIGSMVTTSTVDDTEIFEIKITCSDPNEAANIANTFAKVTPEVIQSVIYASSVRVIDYAKPSNVKVSPNPTKNTIIGFLIGLLLSCAFIFIRELFDVRIKNESDIEGMFNYPILGIIPKIGEVNRGQEGYYYRNRYYTRKKDDSDGLKSAFKN